MKSLFDLGHVESLETAAAAFGACIAAHNFFNPEAFNAWSRRILVDHPGKRALILPAGSVVDGELFLDGDAGDPALDLVSAIVVLGDLTVQGRILNESPDNGDFLLVAGNLTAHGIIKGASSIVVLGTIRCDGIVFCDYCPGSLVAGGNLVAPLVISNDHDLAIGGSVEGLLISSELGNMRTMLVASVFADPDDLDDEWPDANLVRQRLESGLPLLATE